MENIRVIIQKNCRRLFDESNLTLVEIARLAGVSGTTIQRWKNGENTPEVNNIEKLSEILKVRPSEFFKMEDEPQDRKDESMNLIKQIASLGPTELEILRENLEELSKPVSIRSKKKEGIR